MDVTEALTSRHSTRQFTDQPVDLATVKAIIQAAQQAPSWVNAQPEHVYVATGNTLLKIRQAHQQAETAQTAGHSDLPVMSRQDWSKRAQANMQAWNAGLATTLGADWGQQMHQAGSQLYNVPVVIYLTLPTGYSPWSLYDLGAVGQSILLAARGRGLDSMTAYQFVKFPDILRRELAIPADQQIISGIGLGYRDAQAPINRIRAARNDLATILTIKD